MKKGRLFLIVATALCLVGAAQWLLSTRTDRGVDAPVAIGAEENAPKAEAEATESAGNEAPAVVAVVPAALIRELQPRQYAGRLEPIDDVDIVPRVTGWLEEVHFKEGDFVKEGDLLFEIEDTTYRVAVDKAEAGLAQANAELKNAQTIYDRSKELLERNAGSQQDFDNAEQRLFQAKAALQLAEASLVDARNTLSYTKITAPISGRIGKTLVTRGNLVTPQTGKIVDVKSFAPIHLRFAIGESVFSRVFGGEANIRDRAVVKVCPVGESRDDPEVVATFPEAKIDLVDNKVDVGTNTVVLWAILENADMRFFPGSYATVMLSRKLDAPVVGVIASALQTNGEEEFVYVVNSENRVERRVVTLGPISGKYQILESGVEADELVVVEGMNKLQPGALVEPAPAEPTTPESSHRPE